MKSHNNIPGRGEELVAFRDRACGVRGGIVRRGMGAAGLVLAAALMVSGCGSDSKPRPVKASGTMGLDGTWASDAGADYVSFGVADSTALMSTPRTCVGSVNNNGGIVVRFDNCTDGNTDRASGRATLSDDGRTLSVTWQSGIQENFKRQ